MSCLLPFPLLPPLTTGPLNSEAGKYSSRKPGIENWYNLSPPPPAKTAEELWAFCFYLFPIYLYSWREVCVCGGGNLIKDTKSQGAACSLWVRWCPYTTALLLNNPPSYRCRNPASLGEQASAHCWRLSGRVWPGVLRCLRFREAPVSPAYNRTRGAPGHSDPGNPHRGCPCLLPPWNGL